MTKYKIVFDKGSCIGAGQCASACPELWSVKSDGKAELKGAKLNAGTGNYELEIDETQLKKQRDVAARCPVECIKITG